jgi:hypothetical protein
MMDSQPPQPGESTSKSSWLAGTTSNTAFIGTQQECKHKVVHQDIANAATEHMTQDEHLKIVHKTESDKIQKLHAVGCQYIQTKVNSRQLFA